MRADRAARLGGGAATMVLLAVQLSGQALPSDQARSAFQHRREVTLPPGEQPLVALALPPELLARLQPGLRDLRLVGPDGRDVPWVADRQAPRQEAQQWSGSLGDARREKRVSSQWLVDLGASRRFGEVELQVAGTDFAKRLRLEASDDAQAWRLLRDDAGVFDRPWGAGRARRTTIELLASQEARYLRLTADDTRSPPIDLEGLSARDVRVGPEARWELPAQLVPEGRREGWSRYRVEAGAGLPAERLTLVAAEPAFSRRARLIEVRPGHAGDEERLLAEATLWRLKLDEAHLVGESLELEVEPGVAGRLLLEIEDGDSPPLRQPGAAWAGPSRAWSSRARPRGRRSTTATRPPARRSTTWPVCRPGWRSRRRWTRPRWGTRPRTRPTCGRRRCPRSARPARRSRRAAGATPAPSTWNARTSTPSRSRPRTWLAPGPTWATCGWWTSRGGRSPTSSSRARPRRA